MNSWFTVKVKYTKQLENGAFKRVSEPYLVAAMSFTDAEARIYEELGSIIRGEFVVNGIARTEFHDIFHFEDSDYWYRCKLTYESQDADSEKAKKITQNFLVSAHSVREAYERLKESLKEMLVDFQIPAINLTPIVDIFPFNEELDREISRKPVAAMDDEPISVTGKPVFSAPGSDIDDEEDLLEDVNVSGYEEDEADRELEDEYSDDE